MPAPHILPPDDEAVPTASADNHDVEARHSVKTAAPDIEHVYVEDDPRNWSSRKKYFTFFFVCYAAMAAAVSANIFFPAIDDLQRDLQASQQVINLSVSLFILFQGTVPILWSGISEIYGRKIVYLSAYAIFTASQIGCALSKNQAMFLAFRIIGACGSSAGLTIGGGTIADIYDQHERGTRIGVYYLFPLLGPSLGTLLGGALTLTPAGWRASFWFLVAYGASTFVWTLFFKDTFRKERSLAWTKAMRRAQDAAKAKDAARKAQNGSHSPVRSIRMPWSHSRPTSRPDSPTDTPVQAELPTPSPFDGGRGLKKVVTESGEEVPVKVHLADINPLSAVGVILRQPANSLAIVASGLLFGGQYSLVFTGALSFADAPYSYSSLEVGLVLLCFGVGNIVGSVCGGKYSDIVLAKFKSRYGGKAIAEWRLRATLWAMPFVPLTFVAYAWAIDQHVPVYGACIILFLAGVASIWVYSATLAYLVDSSVGMASSAVSCNSMSRGVFGFLAGEVAEPLLSTIGNGWLYTLWAILETIGLAMLVLVCWKGNQWRQRSAAKKNVKDDKCANSQQETEKA